MKQLFSSSDNVQMGLLRSRLEAAGIPCEMRNEHLSCTWGIGGPFDPELWVLDDKQFTAANELLNEWFHTSTMSEAD